MDELRSTIFSASLRRLSTEALQPGERVLWQGQWGKRTMAATRLEDTDATFEILDIGRGAGHLNFASGRSTRSPDTDYTGRYGFRCVRNPSAVRDILERARR